ncbi:MAG: META domain-containing protein [Bacteroidota bacterium]
MKRNIFLIAMLAVLLSTSACKRLPIDPTDDPKDTTYVPLTHKLNGTAWKLIDIGSDGGRRNGNVEGMYTLKFSDKMAGGQAACNATYSADFKADEKNITFMKVMPTPANCGDAGMNEIYYNALKTATTYSFMGGSALTIYASNGAILYFEDMNIKPPQQNLLIGTSWQLFGHQDNRSMMPAPIPVNEKIILTFGLQPDAFGGTSFNKYTVNWKADDKSISFYNLISTKVGVPPASYENEYYRILSGAATYQILDNGKTLVISDAIESLYFHTEDYIHPPSDFKGVVQFANFQVVKFRIDPFEILNVKKIDETHISITVQYSGGCEEHEFNLFADENIQPGNATDFVQMMLTHNSNGDMCEALITKELTFDVSPLIKKWHENPHGNHRLVLQFSQSNSAVIEFTR